MRNKSFEEIREMVASKYEPLRKIPRSYLNDHGQFIHDVYEELDECVSFSDNLSDFVEQVRWNIEQLLKPQWYRSPEFEEENQKIAEKLKKFVRMTVDKELWESIPEFANRKEKE